MIFVSQAPVYFDQLCSPGFPLDIHVFSPSSFLYLIPILNYIYIIISLPYCILFSWSPNDNDDKSGESMGHHLLADGLAYAKARSLLIIIATLILLYTPTTTTSPHLSPFLPAIPSRIQSSVVKIAESFIMYVHTFYSQFYNFTRYAMLIIPKTKEPRCYRFFIDDYTYYRAFSYILQLKAPLPLFFHPHFFSWPFFDQPSDTLKELI